MDESIPLRTYYRNKSNVMSANDDDDEENTNR